MVFMSKLLRQAESSQIWSQIKGKHHKYNLHSLLPISSTPVQGLNPIRCHVRPIALVRWGSTNLSRFFIKPSQDIQVLTARKEKSPTASKGVKKPKSMAFNNIQARQHQQISSASQMMLQKKQKTSVKVIKPQDNESGQETTRVDAHSLIKSPIIKFKSA
jgi:hypothetical protein